MATFDTELASLSPNINQILAFASQHKCSDVFIEEDTNPYIYRFGMLYKVPVVISELIMNDWLNTNMLSEMHAIYVREKMFDFSFSIQKYRYRVNAGFSKGKKILTFRMISPTLPTFQSLNIPPIVPKMLSQTCNKPGIVLLTGATGPLSLDTIVPTTKGYTTMKDIKVGDYVFDINNKPTKVVEVYPIQYSQEGMYSFEVVCDGYVQFFKADGKHKFPVTINDKYHLMKLADIYQAHLDGSEIFIKGNKESWYVSFAAIMADTEVRCIRIESDSHLFLITDHKEKEWEGGEEYSYSTIATSNSGKSSTFAAAFNQFSQKGGLFEDAHVITLEEPIEAIFPSNNRVLITQKEYGKDFMSYPNGIAAAMREHPKVVSVGETRDKKTALAISELARTGHTVLSTFHAASVSETISRLSMMLGKEDMYDLILSMNYIQTQKLEKGRKNYIFWYQYCLFTDQIKDIIGQAIEQDKNLTNVMNKLMTNQTLLNW